MRDDANLKCRLVKAKTSREDAATERKDAMKLTKRILKIETERMINTDPDTSWLGEYSDRKTSEFSIDRAHDEDCQTQSELAQQAVEQLERILAYLSARSHEIGNDSNDIYYWGLDDACDLIGIAQDELAECDCSSGGNWNNREYRYFNPSLSYVDKNGRALPGNTPEDIRKYTKQDYDRLESLYAGNWSFIGIDAKAEIVIGSTCQTITSGGLWGIESDSGEDYLKEEEQNQLAELRTQLYELGFSKRAIAAAIKAV